MSTCGFCLRAAAVTEAGQRQGESAFGVDLYLNLYLQFT